VGKSTQIQLLTRETGLAEAGPLDTHDPRWADVHALGLADWWFRRAALEEVVDVLACSHLARSATADSTGVIRQVGRWMPMLEATVVATAAVRERFSYEAPARRTRTLLAAYLDDLERPRLVSGTSCSYMRPSRRGLNGQSNDQQKAAHRLDRLPLVPAEYRNNHNRHPTARTTLLSRPRQVIEGIGSDTSEPVRAIMYPSPLKQDHRPLI